MVGLPSNSGCLMSNNLENTYCQIRSARAFFVVPAVSRAGSLTEQVRAPFKVQGQNWGRLGNSRTVDEPALKHPALSRGPFRLGSFALITLRIEQYQILGEPASL